MKNKVRDLKMKWMNVLPVIFLLVILSACSTSTNFAPVEDRAVTNPPKVVVTSAQSLALAPVAPGYYRVQKGDSLYRIASMHQQNYQDLARWNNLADVNTIQEGQVLRIVAPNAAVIINEQGVPAESAPESVQVGAVPVNRVDVIATTPASITNDNVPNITAPKGMKQAYSEEQWRLAQQVVPQALQAPQGAQSPQATRDGELKNKHETWAWPVAEKLLSPTNFSHKTNGIDIYGSPGEPVLAAAAGKVAYVGSGIRGYGNLVIIKHTDTMLSAYAHNRTILVKEGSVVARGQKIAEMGNSDATRTQLHFEIRLNGKPVNVRQYLPNIP